MNNLINNNKNEIIKFYNQAIIFLLNHTKIYNEKHINGKKIIISFEIKIDKKNNQIKAIYNKEIIDKNIKIANKRTYNIIFKMEITPDTNKINNAILKEEANNNNYIIVSDLSINAKYIYNNIKETNNYDNFDKILNNKKVYQILSKANKELSEYNNNEKKYRKKNYY